MEVSHRIGLLHYSCPPIVGGVEVVLSHQALAMHRMNQNISVLAGMGEVYTEDFPVGIEPLISSQNREVSRAHAACREGGFEGLKELTGRIYGILKDWSRELEVISTLETHSS